MTTQVQICNQALILLGHDTQVNSIFPPDGSHEAELFHRYWEPSLAELISAREWSHCQKIVSLSRLSSPPTHFYWKYAFSLPTDCVKPLRFYRAGLEQKKPVNPTDIPKNLSAYLGAYILGGEEVEIGIDPDTGLSIVYSNEDELWLKYQFLNNNSATYPQLFSTALSALLASKVAVPLTKDVKLQEFAFKQYVYWREEANKFDIEQQKNFETVAERLRYPTDYYD